MSEKKKKSSKSGDKKSSSKKKSSSSSSKKEEAAPVVVEEQAPPKEKKPKKEKVEEPAADAAETSSGGAKGPGGITIPPRVGYEDMTKMEDMTLDGVLANLSDRYEKDLIYTFTSSILVAINPYQRLPIYGKAWVKYYRGKRIGLLPPHVYAVAEAAYSSMIDHNVNQSVLVSGESGAGKTETTKLIMQYLSDRPDREQTADAASIDRMVLATFPVLEALGNAKTIRNDNSSRFGKFIELQFDDDGYIHGSRIIPYLLEKSRIVRQAKGERNYHIFYNVTNGMEESEQKEFHLHRAEYFDYLNTTGCYTADGVSEEEEYKGFRECLGLFQVSKDMQDNIFRIISSVLHCGNVQYAADGDNAVYPEGRSADSIATVAELLSVDLEKLKQGLTIRKIKTMREVIEKPLNALQAKDSIDAFAKHVYATLFEWTVQQLNANMISESYRSFIGVLDIFGFEVFELNSFEQFLINYTNEKLQQFFNHQIFKLEQQIYEEENIDWSVIEFKDNQECLDLIEKRRPPGLLSILDEESKFPRATDESLIEKLHNNFDKKHSYYERPRLKRYHFSVKHFAGSVEYDITGWREKNRDELPDHLVSLLQNSSSDFVSILYTGEEGEGTASEASPHLKVAEQGSGKRMSFGPGGGGGGGKDKKDSGKMTLGAQFKQQLTDLMAMLGSTEPYFIRCIKPNSFKKPNTLDAKMTYDQLLYAGMLETIRIRRMGYPIRYTLEDFWKRYRCVAPEVAPGSDQRATAEALVKAMGLNIPHETQIGKTKVFFKQDTANDIEDRRNIALTSVIMRMQTWWRMAHKRSTFVEQRQTAHQIQTWFRCAARRKAFVQQHNSSIMVQCFWRMIKAKRVRAALAEAKRKKEEARRKKEEEERKKRVAKMGLEAVEEEEREKQAQEAEKLRKLAAGITIGEDEEDEEAKKKAKKKKLQRSASIKMEKMQELEVPINVDGKIILGIGWQESKWDLDVSVLLFRYNSHREDVYFYKPRSRDGAVQHKSGYSGSKKKFGQDNEHIDINLSKMSAKTTSIIIVATVFNPKGNFSSVKDAYVRLVDFGSEHEFCHYPVPPSSNTANIICKLFRYGFTRWRLKAIGEPSGGRVYKHMIKKVQPFLEAEPSKKKFKVTIHKGDFTVQYPEGQEPGRKSTLNTFCYIRADTGAEKSKVVKMASPKHNQAFTCDYSSTKTISGQANSLEITVVQTKRMGKEVFMGRVIIDVPETGKLAMSEEVLKLEEPDKEWARDLVSMTGTVTVSIDQF